MQLPYVSFQDANFAKRLEWRWSQYEGWSQRWVPYGMPRINPNLPNSVFFLYGIDPQTGHLDGPLGTGVLMGFPHSGTDPQQGLVRHAYAVTCHHVAVYKGASVIRINTKDGKSRFIELEPDEWHFISDGDDLAAVDITDRISHDTDLIATIPINWLATRSYINNISLGEDGFMLGLFAELPAGARNSVAARFGNISLFAQDDLFIETNFKNRPAHLFDMHSRPGFSGSPVFVYRTPGSDIRRVHSTPRKEPNLLSNFRDVHDSRKFWDTIDNTFIKLLGIHVGQFHDTVNVERIGVAQSGGKTKEAISIPNSMAVIAPAWSVAELLMISPLIEQRESREQNDPSHGKYTAWVEFYH